MPKPDKRALIQQLRQTTFTGRQDELALFRSLLPLARPSPVGVLAVYGAVGRHEGDFWMKPEDELTERLVDDLNAYAGRHRILLMFDNYEWIGDFDDWVRERLWNPLDNHVLLVIGGRRRLESRGWRE